MEPLPPLPFLTPFLFHSEFEAESYLYQKLAKEIIFEAIALIFFLSVFLKQEIQ